MVEALEFLGGGALVDLYAMSWVRVVLQLLEVRKQLAITRGLSNCLLVMRRGGFSGVALN